MLSLEYLSNFWKTLEMSLINCEINLTLTWFNKCVLSNTAAQATAFAITDAKIYVPVVTLDKTIAKLLQKLKSGFKRTIS